MFCRCLPSAHCQRSTDSTSTRPLFTPPAPSKPPVLLPFQGVGRCSQSLEEPGGASDAELPLHVALSVMLLSRDSLFGVRSSPICRINGIRDACSTTDIIDGQRMPQTTIVLEKLGQSSDHFACRLKVSHWCVKACDTSNYWND